jgi:hypothetical protein
VNQLTLVHFLVFMSDFVSAWFKNYSIYLAGERSDEIGNAVENGLLSVYTSSTVGHLLIGLLSECFFIYEFIDFNFASFLELTFI